MRTIYAIGVWIVAIFCAAIIGALSIPKIYKNPVILAVKVIIAAVYMTIIIEEISLTKAFLYAQMTIILIAGGAAPKNK